jgi:hypothetical protein
MVSLPRVRLALALAAGLALALPLALSLARAGADDPAKKDKDKEPFKRVPIRTVDGVELQGFFYPSNGKKDACVLLLHNFDQKKGGDCHKDGWDDFAQKLQDEGYAVLAFDFRGMGESKAVGKEFWDLSRNPHNKVFKGAGTPKQPENIDVKDFPPNYFPHLVNDVAAAKAYLERQGGVNSSNTIVIGAGEGATLGAIWAEAEWRCQRLKGLLPGGRFDLDEPEGKDLACAVWLTISPSLAGRKMPLRDLLIDVGAEHKMPMAFLYGKDDTEGREVAQAELKSVRAAVKGGGKLDFTGEKAIADTKLSGSQLLQKGLDTDKWILKDYLEPVLEKRGSREAKKRMFEQERFYWVFRGGVPIPAKLEREDMLRPVPLKAMGIQASP